MINFTAVTFNMDKQHYICYDHLGNEFPTLTAMLKHYNVSKTSYHRCLKKNIPLSTILTKYKRKDTKCYDHIGNEFETITAMLQHYNVSDSVYLYGIKNNIPLEIILTKHRHNSTDHMNQTFKTMKDMCLHWNISINIVKRRLKDGWSLEKALTEPPRRPYSFPKIIYDEIVQQHLQIIKHIGDTYFLCRIDNSDIILLKEKIIEYAKQIKKKRKEIIHNGLEPI